MLPILYSFRRCPYAIRARISLAISNVRCDHREVILRNRPEHMMEISPKGTVPVLLLPDGIVIEESLDIMTWCTDEEYLPNDDQINLITRNDEEFKYHLDRYKYPDRFENTNGSLYHREKALVFLKDLENIITEYGNLHGESAGFTDIAIMPFVRQFANTDRDWFDNLDMPHLQLWLNNYLESELFVSIMKKHPPWNQGDEMVVFPFDNLSN